MKIGAAELASVEAAAVKRAETLQSLHRDALARQPALAEPFAIVMVGVEEGDEDEAPEGEAARADAQGALCDPSGKPIALAHGGEDNGNGDA